MVNFDKCMNAVLSNAKSALLVPAGTYTARMQVHSVKQPTGKLLVPIISFPFALVAPGLNVDPEQLATFTQQQALSTVVIPRDVFLEASEDELAAVEPLRKFLENSCGLDILNKTTAEAIASAVGHLFTVNIIHKLRNGTADVYDARIDKVAPSAIG